MVMIKDNIQGTLERMIKNLDKIISKGLYPEKAEKCLAKAKKHLVEALKELDPKPKDIGIIPVGERLKLGDKITIKGVEYTFVEVE